MKHKKEKLFSVSKDRKESRHKVRGLSPSYCLGMTTIVTVSKGPQNGREVLLSTVCPNFSNEPKSLGVPQLQPSLPQEFL